MALIICPECGKTISDKAKFCVHCGYPIEEAENTARMPAEDSVMPDWKCPLCGVTNVGNDPTCKVCGFNKPEHELKVEAAAKRKQIPSSVCCPNCGSTNVKKISATKRLFSAELFGLASSSIGKQFQCMEKNCGYKW